ncbi:MAG: HNH endonuclease [Deltaproteobacteria bacterium]|nr:HNH endonuclease [Deltaproteobacteria bacterium]
MLNFEEPPPPPQPEPMPDWLQFLIGAGVVIGGVYVASKVIDALTEPSETPAERRRRALNGVRLGLPAGERFSFPRDFRDEISRAHAWRCHYCGVRTTRTTRRIDHAKSLANGGSNDPRNLVNACDSCNAQKGAMNAGEFVALLRKMMDD